jgi:hypothetical protein
MATFSLLAAPAFLLEKGDTAVVALYHDLDVRVSIA